MIISKSQALKLIREGKARRIGELKPNSRGEIYAILDRYDEQRQDHYLDRDLECTVH